MLLCQALAVLCRAGGEKRDTTQKAPPKQLAAAQVVLQSLGECATAAQASQWEQQLTQVPAPAQAVLRSFGEAVAAVNSSDPGSLVKLEQLGKVAAYTTWLADPDAVASTFNGTVRPPAVPRSDIIKFAGAAASEAAPHSGAGWRRMADNVVWGLWSFWCPQAHFDACLSM